MDILLQPQQALKLAKLLDYADLAAIPILTTTSEAVGKPELTMMTSDEIAELTYRNEPVVVLVDDEIIRGIPELVKQFKVNKYWYNKFNGGIVKVLGKSEGSLFLALMAAFSAQTGLEQNLALTVRAYHAVSADTNTNDQLLLAYIDMIEGLTTKQVLNLKKTMQDMDTDEPGHEFSNLKYHKFIVTHGKTPNQLTGANKIIRYYIDNGKQINNKSLTKLIASAIEKSGDIKKDRLLGGFKILNFALNLLDPNYHVKEIDWLPVTIDSWMIYFFYPQIIDMEKDDKEKAKQQIFGGYKKYTYLAKIIQEQAPKFNMKPHQLQAVLWMSSITKYRPKATTKDIHSTLTYMIEEFKNEQNDLRKMTEFVMKLDSVIK